MKTENYVHLVKKIEQCRQSLSLKKGSDYATEDVLSNFKRMQRMAKELDIDVRRSAADCARFLLLLKVDRWCNLAKKNSQPQNEAVIDTVMDAHNYIDLAYACQEDQKDYEEFMRDHKAEIDNDDFCGKPDSAQ